MSTSTCLGATRSWCRGLPRAASCGHGEPQVSRDPANTYCRAAVNSPHRTSHFGCPDRASDDRLPTLCCRRAPRNAGGKADADDQASKRGPPTWRAAGQRLPPYV